MPRQQVHHRRGLYEFPDDFPECLRRLKEASGLSWSELARRLGTSPLTIRRWMQGVQPTSHYLLALQDLAEELGLPTCYPGPGRCTGSRRARPGQATTSPALLLLHPLPAVPTVTVAAAAVRLTLRARRVSFWPVFPGSRVSHPISGSNRRSGRSH